MKPSIRQISPRLKRVLALLLMLCLLPVGLSGSLAEDRPLTNLFGSSLSENQDYVHTFAIVGDTIYIKTSKAFYTYKIGDEAPVLHTGFDPYPIPPTSDGLESREVTIHQLVSDGTQLYALDLYKQSLYQLAVEADELVFSKPIKLDLSDFLRDGNPFVFTSQPLFAFIHEGKLYLRHPNYEEDKAELQRFDLANGEKTTFKTRHLQQMTPYKDGKFLAVRHDRMNAYDPQTFEPIAPGLVIFDPAADSVEDVGLAMELSEQSDSVSAIYYDAREDSLYTHSATDVLRYDEDFKKQRLIGYLPTYGSMSSSLPGGVQPFGDDQLIIVYYTNVFLRPLDETGLQGITVLTITGSLDDSIILQNVLMEMDDVVLRQDDTLKGKYVDGDELATLFITGAVNFDLMIMNAYSFDLDKLMEKGYLADLSGSSVISEYTNNLEHGIKQGVTHKDGIYAAPVTLMVVPVSAYVKNFEAAGLPLPQTIPELVQLYADWYSHLGNDLADFRLTDMNAENVKIELLRILVGSYMSEILATGQELVFDTPRFKDLLQKINSIKPEAQGKIDWQTPEGQAAMEEEMGKKLLLQTGMGFEPQYSVGLNNAGDRQFVPLILPMEEGGQGYERAEINMLAVLSTSKNKEAATRFIEHYLNKLNVLERAAFDKTWTTPIENPKYEEGVKMQETRVNQIKESIKNATGAEKSSLEENLRYLEESLAGYRENGKFMAPQRDIDMLRDLMRKMFISNGLANAQFMAVNEEYELLDQYAQGAITMDQFVKQLDDKLRLVRMEYQ
ncbi:MAG: extracellular solute-binding protein [Clostridiales bacterium]|nr:extracellular solute-binding protein [Clostridiales bacterium]